MSAFRDRADQGQGWAEGRSHVDSGKHGVPLTEEPDGAHASRLEIRPHVSAALAASLADEPRFNIGSLTSSGHRSAGISASTAASQRGILL
jgi:hypothetical protein